MQMIIEARLVDDVQETARIHLAVVDREFTTSPLGLSLAEGKALLASAAVPRSGAVRGHRGGPRPLRDLLRQIDDERLAPKADPYGLRPRDCVPSVAVRDRITPIAR